MPSKIKFMFPNGGDILVGGEAERWQGGDIWVTAPSIAKARALVRRRIAEAFWAKMRAIELIDGLMIAQAE